MSQYDDQLDDEAVTANNGNLDEFSNFTNEVAERKVGSEPIPGFPYYVLEPKGATVAFEFDDKERPILRHRMLVIAGPTGTEGEMLYVDQRMYAMKENWTDEKDANGRPVFEPKSPEELAASIREFQSTLNRVAQAFNLKQANPGGKTAVILSTYARQFEGADRIVGSISRSTRKGFTRNLLKWDSVSALTGPAKDAKFKSALAEAEAKIAAKNKASGGTTQRSTQLRAVSAQAID